MAKHTARKILEHLSISQRTYIIARLLVLLIVYRFRDLKSLRARVHWIGYHRRPRRLERVLLFTIIIGAAFVLRLDQYLLWLSVWSGGAAVFINWCAAYKTIPQNRHHW